MKILMTLANPFTHDPRVYNEALSLIKAGHRVTVLAWDREHKNSPFEKKDGIEVVRSYNTKIMDLAKYDIFKMQLWWKRGYKDALKLLKNKEFDVIHSHDLSSLSIGVKLKKKLGLPLIYDAHEIFGYMIINNVPKIFAKTAFSTEKKWIKDVDHIITVNEPLADYFRSISNKPITIIMNCKPVQGTKYNPPNTDKFTLLYLGSLDKNRFLLETVDVLKELADVYLIIGGKGKPNYVQALKEKCSVIPNVDFIGLIPIHEVLPMTKKTDVILSMTSPYDLNCSRASANKQFEAMVCGRPIICTKGTYPGEFTEKEKCGLVVDYTKEALKEAIIKLRDNPKLCEELGKNALKAAINKYNWELEEKKLQELYKKLKVKK
ncbi:MAG: glycosyltransferase family 4 protein [Thermoplasmatales archaeon]|nr:glycosyltransferase family 4 protein [Thermoplasmatales archaeon]